MTHRWPIRVYYEDVDLAGIVYYANYLKFIERARSEMVRKAGVYQVSMREAALVFDVTRIEAHYLSPARYDDELEIVTELAAVSRVRFEMDQTVSRAGATLFRAKVTIVCMDLEGRPRRLPPAVNDLAE